MTLIIGISGKKQSGKSSLAKFIQACLFKKKYPDVYDFVQRPDGTIQWRHKDDTTGEIGEPSTVKYKCKIYSFADPLKQDVCMKVLGLSHEQCYGTEGQKNSLTRYRWDRFNEITRLSFANEKKDDYPVPRAGFMTSREVLQVVGTEIFRKCFGEEIWVEATLNIIKEKSPEVAHASEVELDDYDFEGLKRCFEIDNNDLSLSAKNDIAIGILNTIF